MRENLLFYDKKREKRGCFRKSREFRKRRIRRNLEKGLEEDNFFSDLIFFDIYFY
jgi:hypothetical protein